MLKDKAIVIVVFCAVIKAHEQELGEIRKLNVSEKISTAGESAKLEESQLYYIKSILSLLDKFKADKAQTEDEAANLNADPTGAEGDGEADEADKSKTLEITNDKSRQLDLTDYFTGDWYDKMRKEQLGHSEESERKETGASRLDIELNEDDFPDDNDDIDNPKFYDDVDINGGFMLRRFVGDPMIETKGRTGIKLEDRISDPSPQLQGDRRFFISPLGIRGLYLSPGTYQHAAPTNHPFTFGNINSRDIFTLSHDLKQPSLVQLPPSGLSQSQPSGLLKPSGLSFLSKYRRLESGLVDASTEDAGITSVEKNDNAYPFEPNQSVSGYLRKRLWS